MNIAANKSVFTIKNFIVILLLFLSANMSGQSTKKKELLNIFNTYGYLLGQEYYLNIIQNEYPQLELDVKEARNSFKSNFGIAKREIIIFFKKNIGAERFSSITDNLKEKIKKVIYKKNITPKIATNFIEKVKNRAKGDIKSPVLEVLLSFQYNNKPEQEFLNGFTNIFTTNGHSKSKGIDWQIKLPKSWIAKERNSPNIIQMFISDRGRGNQSIIIMIKETPLTNVKFTEKEIKNIIPKDGKFISFTQIKINDNIGGLVIFKQAINNKNSNIRIQMAQFMFIEGNKMFLLQCSVVAKKAGTDLSMIMSKYLPLFKLVANSTVVNN